MNILYLLFTITIDQASRCCCPSVSLHKNAAATSAAALLAFAIDASALALTILAFHIVNELTNGISMPVNRRYLILCQTRARRLLTIVKVVVENMAGTCEGRCWAVSVMLYIYETHAL